MATHEDTSRSQWPYGADGMAARIRDRDWSTTPLGPIGDWPQSLKTVVDIMLASRSMMSLVWGPDAIHLFNDSFTELLREHHEVLLGRSALESFARSAESFAADIAAGMAGRSARMSAQRYPVLRDGRLQNAWFDVDYVPVRDEAGAVAGVLWTLRETTAQVRAEQALRDREARHRLLIGSWAQAVWETDPDGVVVADSPSWRACTGQTVAEWLGYGWLDAIHPDDRGHAERQWHDAIAARGLVDAEFRLRQPGGGWRWTNVRAAPVRDQAGGIAKWVGMNIDIDARRRAEGALRDSETLLAAVFNSIPSGLGVTDMAGRIVLMNDAMAYYLPDRAMPSTSPERSARWYAETADGKRLPPTDYPSARSLRGESVAGVEMRYTADDGGIRWTTVAAAPIFDAGGTLMGQVTVITDIDAQHRLQQRQQLLVAELQHRVRNILTVIRLTFARTFEQGGSLEEVASHFRGRLDAMARTQVALSRAATRTADLEDMIRDELLSIAAAKDDAITIDGPAVSLDHRTAEMLGMALHELATNALKYGALRGPHGSLHITWNKNLSDFGADWLDLRWEERGMPTVSVRPARSGFGRELIEEALPYQLKARTSFELKGGGLRCTISVPLGADTRDPADARTISWH